MPATLSPPAIETAAYTFKDLARLIQASERHLHRLDDLRLIPGRLTFGKLVRFHKATVDEWLAAGCPRGAGR
jgi:hypothetical protein